MHNPWGLRRIAAEPEESQTVLLFLVLKDYHIIYFFFFFLNGLDIYIYIYKKPITYHVMCGCLKFGWDRSYLFAFFLINTSRTGKSTYKRWVL